MPLTAEIAAVQVQVLCNVNVWFIRIHFHINNECYYLHQQERLTSIQGLIHAIDNERRRNENNLNNLNRLQEKYGADEKSNSAQHKLRSQYKMCMNDAIQEENFIRDALAKIQEIRNIRNERRIQVKWMQSIDWSSNNIVVVF